ncbi:cupin domain-containing protein [Motiliproteus coralliicola]|uniref:Cupin domain-containing protein n=1 Tax=Motiliproteus coralliicola TaxID=2283196 RepID=A0A369WDI4_9GAMM|nr:cupin domain-containing protein [Motiliproteus coralliicola]RDE19371.1 cupin domain-containing protein [Motiliproteus coralliicola]
MGSPAKKSTGQTETALDPDNLRIGRQIRDLRKSKRISLVELSGKVNKSVGYLSQVERGVSALPIPVLQSISTALGVQISWFFHGSDDEPSIEQNYVVRRGSRRTLNYSGMGIREELLSPRLSGQLQMIMTTFEPGASGGKEPRQRKGEEAGYVKSGSLELTIGEQKFLLQAGDSFTISGDEPHLVSNPSSQETEVVWVLADPY